MYELTIKGHFDAAHAIRDYPGECRNLHGHTWDVEVTVEGAELDDIGIVYDFKRLKADLGQVLERYDHGYLNEIPPFDVLNTTAENLAKVIFEELVGRWSAVKWSFRRCPCGSHRSRRSRTAERPRELTRVEYCSSD